MWIVCVTMCVENAIQIYLVLLDIFSQGTRVSWFTGYKIVSSTVLLIKYFGFVIRYGWDQMQLAKMEEAERKTL